MIDGVNRRMQPDTEDTCDNHLPQFRFIAQAHHPHAPFKESPNRLYPVGGGAKDGAGYRAAEKRVEMPVPVRPELVTEVNMVQHFKVNDDVGQQKHRQVNHLAKC